MTALAPRLEAARSVLFVPASRPDRYTKAVESGADVVVLDLEDAVEPEAKEAGRAEAARWLSGRPGGVRINAAGTQWFDQDVAAVAAQPCVVMVPKAESPDALREVCAALRPGSAVLALVETAAGVLNAEALARVEGVTRLAFGSLDLQPSTPPGVSHDHGVARSSAMSPVDQTDPVVSRWEP